MALHCFVGFLGGLWFFLSKGGSRVYSILASRIYLKTHEGDLELFLWFESPSQLSTVVRRASKTFRDA